MKPNVTCSSLKNKISSDMKNICFYALVCIYSVIIISCDKSGVQNMALNNEVIIQKQQGNDASQPFYIQANSPSKSTVKILPLDPRVKLPSITFPILKNKLYYPVNNDCEILECI